MKVVIPLQTCSTRVPKKNIRPFFETQSLFDIKVSQLAKIIPLSDIYVSSESFEVETLCKDKGVNFLQRDKSLTGNLVKQPDLVSGIIKDVPGDDDIMWVQVTSPLFDQFSKFLEVWSELSESYDSMVAVKPFSKHLLDSTANPLNFSFGYWHKVSQDLPSWFEVLWSCFILKRKTINQVCYHIGTNPYLFVSDIVTVDIDTVDDFELASIIYKHFNGKNDEN